VSEAPSPDPATPGPGQLRVCLYVAGDSPNSAAALRNLRAALAHLATHSALVEIVDVLQHPERAFRDGIMVTPMLVRREPLPERRVLGNLSDRAKLQHALGLEIPQ